MKPLAKTATALGLAAAVSLSAMSPSEARDRWVGPAVAGLAAGAIIGGLVANAAHAGPYGYYDGYASYPGYYDSYAYAPRSAYYHSYAYAPRSSYYYRTRAYAPRVYSGYDAYAAAPAYVAPRYVAPRYSTWSSRARPWAYSPPRHEQNGPHMEDHLTGTGIGAAL